MICVTLDFSPNSICFSGFHPPKLRRFSNFISFPFRPWGAHNILPRLSGDLVVSCCHALQPWGLSPKKNTFPIIKHLLLVLVPTPYAKPSPCLPVEHTVHSQWVVRPSFVPCSYTLLVSLSLPSQCIVHPRWTIMLIVPSTLLLFSEKSWFLSLQAFFSSSWAENTLSMINEAPPWLSQVIPMPKKFLPLPLVHCGSLFFKICMKHDKIGDFWVNVCFPRVIYIFKCPTKKGKYLWVDMTIIVSQGNILNMKEPFCDNWKNNVSWWSKCLIKTPRSLKTL